MGRGRRYLKHNKSLNCLFIFFFKCLSGSEGILTGIYQVQEAIRVPMLVVNRGEEAVGREEGVVDKNEQGALWAHFDPVPNDRDKVGNSKVGRDNKSFHRHFRQVRAGQPFTNDLGNSS